MLRKNNCLQTDQLKEKLHKHKLKHPNESYVYVDLSFNKLTNLSDIFACSFFEINYLILNRCEIAKICPGAFRSLINLKVLHLNGNVIERLPASCLIENRQLQVLEVFHNKIVFVSPKFVDPVANLRILNLAWNNLNDFSNITLNQLEKLFLNSNKLTRFANNCMPNAKVVKLSRNLLGQLTVSMFDRLPALEHINCGQNEIRQLTGSIFARNSSLVTLKINHNWLEDLNGSLFECGSRLQNLHLCRNRISELHANLFRNVFDLKRLFLDGNRLEVLKKSWFDALPKLKVLSANANCIGCFEPFCFNGLLSLEEFYFNNNTCPDDYSIVIDHGLFNENKQLRIIEIRNSKIANIGDKTFDFVKNLEILDLSENLLHHLPNKLLPNQAHLKKLRLEHNYLKQFAYVIGAGGHDANVHDKNKQCYGVRVDHLNLSGNPMTFFDEHFAKMLNLRSLNLSGVSFKNLALINFEQLPSLVDLKLVNCEIESFPLRYFWPLRKLKTLNLNQNSFSKTTFTCFDDEQISSRENTLKNKMKEALTPQSNDFVINRKIIFDEALFSVENALKSLSFRSCSLNFLTACFFRDLTDLISLDLCENELSSLADGVFDALKSLAFVSLKCNKFECFDSNPFENNQNLKVIILSKNYITTLNIAFFEKLPLLEKVFIDEFCEIDNNHWLFSRFFNEV